MTEKKCHFADKEQKCPFSRVAQSAFKNGLCVVENLESIIHAIADHPKDIAVSGNQQPNILFLVFRKFLVYKEITQQFGTFHAKGMETVAVSPMAQSQGKFQFVEIQ